MSDEAKTFTKEQQLARGERRYHRKVASPKRWQQIIAAKTGPCRVCESTGPVEFHHTVPRAIGGSDTEACLVPLCHGCHDLVTRRDKAACAALRLSLSDAEYSYAVRVLGEGRFEERFPVEWRNP